MKPQKNTSNNKLSVQRFNRLENIFTSKNWPIESVLGFNYFEHFCERLSSFSDEQQDLILDLTEDFLWIRETEYLYLFRKSFDIYYSSIPNNCKNKIIICPLLSPKDFNKSKSSTALYHLLDSVIKEFQLLYSTKCSISLMDFPQREKEIVDLVINQNFTLCLIDDYIGSGETLIEGVKHLEDNGILRDSIVIISLVAMRDSYNFLISQSYNIYSDCILEKGLTKQNNNYFNELMNQIETKLKVKDDYRFGYKQTEALLKMKKTPNNTFPVYWFDKSIKHITAPFPR